MSWLVAVVVLHRSHGTAAALSIVHVVASLAVAWPSSAAISHGGHASLLACCLVHDLLPAGPPHLRPFAAAPPVHRYAWSSQGANILNLDISSSTVATRNKDIFSCKTRYWFTS